MRGIRVLGVVVGCGVLAACGAAQQADDPAAATEPQLDGVACSEVIESSNEHRDTLSRTFGGGEEGRAAQLALVESIEARPDCFDQDSREAAVGLRELLPSSDAEREAIEDAESRCVGGVGGGGATATPDDPPQAPDPEDALTAEQWPQLPRGEPERTAEGDHWVAFDFHDGDVYEGRAMVERSGDDWFVRRVIDCGIDEAVVEEEADDDLG